VTSAITFLQDPNVVGSSVENKISFLRSKNLTQEEIDASFARSGQAVGGTVAPVPSPAAGAPPAYYPPPQHYPPQSPYGAWPQAPPQEPPRRDWRDLFIMATVVGGVSYGLYSITKVCKQNLLESGDVKSSTNNSWRIEIHISPCSATDTRKTRARQGYRRRAV